MISRSGNKKTTPVVEVATPLSSLTKKKRGRKPKVETKTHDKSPVAEETGQNIQSPIFNIHVHMPAVPDNLHESSQVQPVIHLHFGDVVSGLTSSSASQNFNSISKLLKIETLPDLNCNVEVENSDGIVIQPSEKNLASRMLSCKSLNEEGLGTEESDAVFNENDMGEQNVEPLKMPGKGGTPVKKNIQANYPKYKKVIKKKNMKQQTLSVSDSQLPLRRSPRVANDIKLLKQIEAVRVNKSKAKEAKTKKCKAKTKSDNFLKPFAVKNPFVVLCEKCRVIENEKKEEVRVSKVKASDEDCRNDSDASALEVMNDSSSSETHESCDENTEMSVQKSSHDDNTFTNESDKQELKVTSHDETSSESGESEIKNIECLMEDVKNTSNDDSSAEVDDNDALDEAETGRLVSENGKKCEFERTSSMESLLSLTKKSSGIYFSVYTSDNDSRCKNNLIDFEKKSDFPSDVRINPMSSVLNDCETEIETSNLVSNNAEQSYCDNVNGTAMTAMDVHSDSSSISANLETDLDESSSDESHTKDLDEDDHHMPPQMELDLENANLKNENNSLINIEEIKLLPTNPCEEKCVASSSFQLELSNKEPQISNMTRQNGKPKNSIKKKKLQVPKRKSEAPTLAKKMKPSDKTTKSDKTAPTEKKPKQASLDYISLNATGPTKFAVAQINYTKPSEHKAKNFKEAMLLDNKRIQRFSDSSHLRTYRLKKEAAAKRNKFRHW